LCVVISFYDVRKYFAEVGMVKWLCTSCINWIDWWSFSFNVTCQPFDQSHGAF